MELATALSVGSTVVVLIFTAVIGPLLRYIISQKDEQVSGMRNELKDAKSRLEAHEKEDTHWHEKLGDKVNSIELDVTKLTAEVNVIGSLRLDMQSVRDRLDTVVQELAGLKAAMNERSRSYQPQRSNTGFPTPIPRNDPQR